MDSKPESKRLLDWEAMEVPFDAEGYCRSFDSADSVGIAEFIEGYGFVVIHDVLSGDACEATMAEVFSMMATGGHSVPDPERPETWGDFGWARQDNFKGVIGDGPILTPQLLSNRQAPELHRAYGAVIGTDELIVNHDRLGVMRPTVGIDLGDGEGPRDRPEWRVKKNWLHIDCNPVSGSPDWPPRQGTELGHTAISSMSDTGEAIDFRKCFIGQGLLLLTDSGIEDGGFCCVPGSHKLCIEWARQHVTKHSINGERNIAWNTIEVPQDDPLHKHVCKIPLRKGSLLVWNSLLFHDNYPNESNKWRAVQYVRMLPASGTPYGPLHPDFGAVNAEGSRIYPESFEATSLGAKLFGFEPWE